MNNTLVLCAVTFAAVAMGETSVTVSKPFYASAATDYSYGSPFPAFNWWPMFQPMPSLFPAGFPFVPVDYNAIFEGVNR